MVIDVIKRIIISKSEKDDNLINIRIVSDKKNGPEIKNLKTKFLFLIAESSKDEYIAIVNSESDDKIATAIIDVFSAMLKPSSIANILKKFIEYIEMLLPH